MVIPQYQEVSTESFNESSRQGSGHDLFESVIVISIQIEYCPFRWAGLWRGAYYPVSCSVFMHIDVLLTSEGYNSLVNWSSFLAYITTIQGKTMNTYLLSLPVFAFPRI